MRRRYFVIRTIRNGRVKINGKIFKPSRRWMEYDGRLDGMRYAFGLYWRGDEMDWFVQLWGTEEAYRMARTDQWSEWAAEHWPGPECVNGFFNWEWWYLDESATR